MKYIPGLQSFLCFWLLGFLKLLLSVEISVYVYVCVCLCEKQGIYIVYELFFLNLETTHSINKTVITGLGRLVYLLSLSKISLYITTIEEK